ncbi:MAG: PorV/PorQ family protein [Candidatus Glassbacteria bacterium]|nr:PorV/PorQ family protein [Candidatus Glassbacteria bacterium]
MKNKLTALVCAALLFAAGNLAAGEVGSTSLNFLKVGVGARPAGMGGAFGALSDDATACFWNPAGLTDSRAGELFFTHHRWIEDISQSAASYTFDVQRVRLGVSMNYFGMGELERRSVNSVEPEGTFSPFDLALGLSAAYRVKDNISAGVTARFVHESLDSETASAMLFDIGIKARTMIPNLTASFVVRNLGTKLKYESVAYDAPRLVSIGAAYRKSLPWRDNSVTVAFEIESPNDNETRLALGGEYNWRNFLLGRAGYRTGLEYEDFSFGMGVNYLQLMFDYAFVPYSDLGNSHRFSFIYAF